MSVASLLPVHHSAMPPTSSPRSSITVVQQMREESSCDDAPSLLHHLPPLSAHALLERKVEHLLNVVARLR